MDMLINKSKVKKFILNKTKQHRPGWNCERVSGEAYKEIDAMLSNMIVKMIKSHPTLGKTFKVS